MIMIRKCDILTRAAAMFLGSVVAVSCSNDGPSPLPLPTPDGPAEIVLTLTVSDTSAGSRAPSTPEGGYDRGEGYENYIDISSLNFRFYFFDGADRYIAPLDVATIDPVETTESSKTYVIHSFGMPEKLQGDVKVVALANWPAYPAEERLEAGKTMISDIVGQTYDFDAAKMELSADNPVPLYGVTNAMTLSYNEDNVANIGTIHLLRAYAKVEVLLSEEAVYPIEWVRLSRYNSKGYCAPANVTKQSDYVYNDYDKDYTKEPRVPEGAETDEKLPFMKVGDGRWLAYVPEYRNIGREDDERSVIEIKFKGAESEVDKVYFAVYDLTTSPNRPKPDGHFDILRNVWYRFTVSKQAAPLVQVVPYNEVDLGPLFGLMVGKEMVPIYDDEGKILYYYDRETGNYYGSDMTTLIENPYITILQPEGWLIIRDLNDRVIGYYDTDEAQYYNTDKEKVPYLDIDASTGWEILRDSSGKVIGYYDKSNNKYYNPDKITENPELGKGR